MSFAGIFNWNNKEEKNKKRARIEVEDEKEEKEIKIIPIYNGELHNNLTIHGNDNILALRQLLFCFQTFFIKNYSGFFELLYSKSNIIIQTDMTKYYFYIRNVSKDVTVSINIETLLKCIKAINDHYIIIQLLEKNAEPHILAYIVYKKNIIN